MVMPAQAQEKLSHWYQSIAGQHLLNDENNLLIKGLNGLFGYHLLSLGSLGHEAAIKTSPISHKVIMSDLKQSLGSANLLASEYELPLQNDSIDVVVLPHLLEYSEQPHQLLREVERVIMPDGHVIILGFNPVSCYGVCRALFGFRQQMPWQGHYYHPVRLRDWLQLLGFKITKIEYGCITPPIPHEATLQYLAFLEKAADSFIAPIGSVYMIVAQNQTVTPNIIRAPWKGKPASLDNGVAEPTTRVRTRH